jgi:hypothetical protein
MAEIAVSPVANLVTLAPISESNLRMVEAGRVCRMERVKSEGEA